MCTALQQKVQIDVVTIVYMLQARTVIVVVTQLGNLKFLCTPPFQIVELECKITQTHQSEYEIAFLKQMIIYK